jgi:hypothetical protein
MVDNKVLMAVLAAMVEDAISKIKLPDNGERGPRGVKGKDGNDFRLEDHEDAIKEFVLQHIPKSFELSEDQIQLLRGKDGRDGKDFSLQDNLQAIEELIKQNVPQIIELTDEQKLELRGKDGQDGRDGERGIRGKDGRDFEFEEHRSEIEKVIKENSLKFEDLSPEQIESLKGRDGNNGRDGKDFNFDEVRESINSLIIEYLNQTRETLKLKFSDLSAEDKEELRGPRGQRGKPGKDFNLSEVLPEIDKNVESRIEAKIPELKLKFEDLTEEDKESLRGAQGAKGKDGRDFDLQEALPEIDKQVQSHIGARVPDLKLKFEDLTDIEKDSLKLKFDHLTVEERMTLRGPRGQRGKQGIQGEQGLNGKDGVDGKSVRGPIGPQGIAGQPGRDGVDGRDGKDAPVITDVILNRNKDFFSFTFKLEDGTEFTTSSVRMPSYNNYFVAGGGGGGGSGNSGVGSANEFYSKHTLMQADIDSKKVFLTKTPTSPIKLTPEGALTQRQDIDFRYEGSDNSITWDGLGLEGFLEVGEVITISFLY